MGITSNTSQTLLIIVHEDRVYSPQYAKRVKRKMFIYETVDRIVAKNIVNSNPTHPAHHRPQTQCACCRPHSRPPDEGRTSSRRSSAKGKLLDLAEVLRKDSDPNFRKT